MGNVKLQAAGVAVAVAVAVALGPGPRLRAESHRQSTSRTTRVVTAADGTTTTTITETVTRNGRTTTTTRTEVRGPGPARSEPADPARPERGREREPERAPDGKKAPPPAADGPALVREALESHNRERHRVGAGDLAWDAKLAGLAQEWARHLCRGGKSPPSLQHRPSTPGGPGENLWAGFTTEGVRFPIRDAVQSWAGERRYYDERSGRCKGGVCGHYTQLVWRDTKKVGCGVATCPAGAFTATVWTCNYSPAGNVVGEKPY
jgi:pathogenesis-related protein 1